MTITTTTNPNMKFNYLQQMDIVIRLEQALAGDGNMVVFSLKQAIRTKQPTGIIIQTVKDMIRDNEVAMAYLIGNTLTDKIKNFDL